MAILLFLCVAAAATAALAWQATRPKVNIDALIASRSVLAVMPFDVAEGVDRRTLGDEVADGITNQLATRIGMRGIGRAATELAVLLRLWPRATVAHFDYLRRSSNPAYVGIGRGVGELGAWVRGPPEWPLPLRS